MVQQGVVGPGIWLGHGVQVPQWSDVICETLALCLCDQGKLEGEEVVDLFRDGCKQEAGEAFVLDLSCAPSADVTHLDERLVSVAVHGLDQLL